MTIEQLLKCDAETLEKLTDAQLLEHFEKYLKVTRPEWAPKQTNKKIEPIVISAKKRAGLEMLRELDPDIDLSFIQKRKR